MTQRRRGLGRGLGALIPTVRPEDAYTTSPPGDPVATNGMRVVDHEDHQPGSGPAAGETGSDEGQSSATRSIGARFAEIGVDEIRTNPRQPRQVFDEEALAELVHSIREIGVLQPIVVRELADSGDTRFELVMGERRWRAARDAGLATVPAIIRDTPDTALLRDALLENLHRAQLNPLEEAAAYDQLLRDFDCTQEQLADRIGRSRPQISNTLRLLRLPPSVQRRLAAGVLSAGHARALLGLPDSAAQEKLAQRIVAEGLSVRSVEELVALGDFGVGDQAPGARSRRPVAPALVDLAARLSDRFETRVRVELGRRKGKIVVEFASITDLERIVAALDPTAVDAVPRQESTAERQDADSGTDQVGADEPTFATADPVGEHFAAEHATTA